MDGTRCPRCGRTLPASEFYASRSPSGDKRGRMTSVYCKECLRQIGRIRSVGFKRQCLEYKGGRCVRCGYDGCQAALEFHHRDPSAKEFSVAQHLKNVGHRYVLTDRVRGELDKCDLLCSNCHREVHFKETAGA